MTGLERCKRCPLWGVCVKLGNAHESSKSIICPEEKKNDKQTKRD